MTPCPRDWTVNGRNSPKEAAARLPAGLDSHLGSSGWRKVKFHRRKVSIRQQMTELGRNHAWIGRVYPTSAVVAPKASAKNAPKWVEIAKHMPTLPEIGRYRAKAWQTSPQIGRHCQILPSSEQDNFCRVRSNKTPMSSNVHLAKSVSPGPGFNVARRKYSSAPPRGAETAIRLCGASPTRIHHRSVPR